MNEQALKAQIKAAAYGLVVLLGGHKTVAYLREVMAEIYKDQRLGDDDQGGGHRDR